MRQPHSYSKSRILARDFHDGEGANLQGCVQKICRLRGVSGLTDEDGNMSKRGADMAKEHPVRRLQVTSNGTTTAYQDVGDGPPIVLLHGAMVSGWMWDRVAALLAERFRLLILDLRGHGFSDNPTGEMTYPLLAADVAAFVVALQLEAPVIAGWSMGGFLAIEVGIRYPGASRALIAGGAAMAFSQECDAVQRDLYAIDAAGEIDLDRFARERAELVEMMEQSHGPGRWRSLLCLYAAMDAAYRLPGGGQRMWTPDQMRQIEQPVLVMASDSDEFIPPEAAVDTFRQLRHGALLCRTRKKVRCCRPFTCTLEHQSE